MSYDYSGYKNHRSQPNERINGPRRNDRWSYDARSRINQDKRQYPYSVNQGYSRHSVTSSETSNKRTATDDNRNSLTPSKRPNYCSDKANRNNNQKSYNNNHVVNNDTSNLPSNHAAGETFPKIVERLTFEANWRNNSSQKNDVEGNGSGSVQPRQVDDRDKLDTVNTLPKQSQSASMISHNLTKTNEDVLKRFNTDHLVNPGIHSFVNNIKNGNIDYYENSALNQTSQALGSSINYPNVSLHNENTSPKGTDSATTIKTPIRRFSLKGDSSTTGNTQANPSPTYKASTSSNTLINQTPRQNNSSAGNQTGVGLDYLISQCTMSLNQQNNIQTTQTLTSPPNQNSSRHSNNGSATNPANNSENIQDAHKNKYVNIPDQQNNVTLSDLVSQTSNNETVPFSLPTNSFHVDEKSPQPTAQCSSTKLQMPQRQPIKNSNFKPSRSVTVLPRRVLKKKTAKEISKLCKRGKKTVEKVFKPNNRKNTIASRNSSNAMNCNGPAKIEHRDNNKQDINKTTTKIVPSTSKPLSGSSDNSNSSQLQFSLDAVVGRMVCHGCQSWIAPRKIRGCLCQLLCEACAVWTPGCLECGKIMEESDKLSCFYYRIASIIPHPCPNKKNGCNAIVIPDEDHEGSCEFQTSRCFGCNDDLLIKMLPDHIQTSHPTSKVLKELKNVNITPTHFIEHRPSSGDSKQLSIYCNKSNHSFWIVMCRDGSNSATFRIHPVFIVKCKKVHVKFEFKFKNYSRIESCTLHKSHSGCITIDKDIMEDWFSGLSTLDIYIADRKKTEKSLTADKNGSLV